MRSAENDLAMARDLRKLGAMVLLIGQELPEDAVDLVLRLPGIPFEWQFVIDIIPAQLVVDRLAALSEWTAVMFRWCSFVVEDLTADCYRILAFREIVIGAVDIGANEDCRWYCR